MSVASSKPRLMITTLGMASDSQHWKGSGECARKPETFSVRMTMETQESKHALIGSLSSVVPSSDFTAFFVAVDGLERGATISSDCLKVCDSEREALGSLSRNVFFGAAAPLLVALLVAVVAGASPCACCCFLAADRVARAGAGADTSSDVFERADDAVVARGGIVLNSEEEC
jgi:hypothetical protein